jgi:hypothetical protein
MTDLPSLHEVRALLADKQEYMAAVQAAARAASDAVRRGRDVRALQHKLFQLYAAEVGHAIRCTAEASCDESERPFAHGFALYDDCFPPRRSLNRSGASRQLRAARSAVVDELAADLRTALQAAGFAVAVHGAVISYALRPQDLPH